MYGIQMLTWLGCIDGKWQTIYSTHTDPMGMGIWSTCGPFDMWSVHVCFIYFLWNWLPQETPCWRSQRALPGDQYHWSDSVAVELEWMVSMDFFAGKPPHFIGGNMKTNMAFLWPKMEKARYSTTRMNCLVGRRMFFCYQRRCPRSRTHWTMLI